MRVRFPPVAQGDYMQLVDYHIHTSYSRDASGTVEDYCKIAQERGILEIAFTNHLNFGMQKLMPQIKLPLELIASIDVKRISEYCKEVENARKKFGIKILLGFEIDYFSEHEDMIRKALDEYPVDFVLGSSHFVDGYPASSKRYSKDLFEGKDEIGVLGVYSRYFRRLKEAVESRLFDVMAHPDIINKYAYNYHAIPFERYEEMARGIIASMVKNGVGIEVNTSGYFSEICDSSPSMEFLRMCNAMGLKIVTIGSDAHRPTDLGRGLERGIEKIKSAGYDSICLFDKRIPKFVKI
jgi:histidinol-phosphatase (PHP family)